MSLITTKFEGPVHHIDCDDRTLSPCRFRTISFLSPGEASAFAEREGWRRVGYDWFCPEHKVRGDADGMDSSAE